MKEYKVISYHVRNIFEKSINDAIKEGWQPIGSLSITIEKYIGVNPDPNGKETRVYHQAMEILKPIEDKTLLTLKN
jgi:hypothetical protein